MAQLLLEDCSLFNGVDADIREGVSIVVDGDEIKEISTGRINSTSANRVSVKGKLVMPGLIDAHFHAAAADIDASTLDRMPSSLLSQHMRNRLEMALQRGFTSVRDMGGTDVGIALAIEQGLIDGPRFFFSGKALSQTGGHGDLRHPHEFEPCACAYHGHFAVLADGADEMRKAAREQLRRGAHQLKVTASGGIASPSDPLLAAQYSEEELRAVVDEATRHGSYVAAHCHPAEAARRCAEYGVRTIEHGTLIDPQTATFVAERGAYVVPTLSVLDGFARKGASLGLPSYSLEKLAEVLSYATTALENCVHADVKLGFGTDLIGPLHVEQCREFLLRAEVQSPFEVLRSATAVNADILNMNGRLGIVAEGALADLIVVDGNPLEDLSVLGGQGENIPLIMKGGDVRKNGL